MEKPSVKQSATRIAYNDPLEVLPEFHRDLLAQFPLLNLHWNAGDGRPLRTVPSLDVSLEALDPVAPQHQLMGLSDSPLVQLFFVAAETSDAYRGKIRKQAQDWRRQLSHSRDPAGWLVVHYVSRGGAKRSKSVWAKILADFEGHAAQLYLDGDSAATRDEWARFTAILKQQVLEAFTARVRAYEAEVRKLQATSDLPGWNFGMLFAMKESLAWSYENMTFLEDAFQVYSDLQRLAEPSFFKAPEDPRTVELPATALRPDRDDITSKMLTQKATQFDFLIYLFSRQLLLLIYISQASTVTSASLADRHITRAVYRAFESLPPLVQVLLAEGVPKHRVYAWLGRTAHEVYEIAQEFGSPNAVQGKGELLLLQRDALQGLAGLLGFHIDGIVSEIGLDISDKKDEELITDRNFAAWLKTPESYEKRFIELTEAAISKFQAASSLRSVNTLSAQLASIQFSKKNYEGTLDLLGDLPKYYGTNGWDATAVRLNYMSLECARKLDQKSQVLELSWSLLNLQSYLTSQQMDRCISYIQELGSLESKEANLESWFHVKVDPWVSGDTGYYVTVTLTKKYPARKFIEFESGVLESEVLQATGPARDPVVFRCVDFTQSTARFYTNHFVEGTLLVKSLHLTFKKQTLTKNFDSEELLIRVHPLQGCFHAELNLSNEFTLQKRNLVLNISSPEAVSCQVRFHALDGLHILTEKQTSTGLVNITAAKVEVPVLTRVDTPHPTVLVAIDYSGGGRYEFTKTLDTSLLIDVHVEEFFRSSVLFSQFLVSCTSSQPVVLEKAELDGGSSLNVRNPIIEENFVAFDGAPISLVYALEPTEQGDGTRTGTDARVALSHRAAQWECEHLLWMAISNLLSKDALQYASMIRGALSQVEIGVVSYVTQNSFAVNSGHVRALLARELEGINTHVLDAIDESLTKLPSEIHRDVEADFSHLTVRLEITVPNPGVDVVHFIELQLEKRETYTVGEPVAAHLRLEPVYRWAKEAAPGSRPGGDLSRTDFEYEIERNSEGWSLNGPYRGQFSDLVEQPVLLVPHKPGKLRLPSVYVVPVDGNSLSVQVVRQYDAEKVLVVPASNRLAITF